VSAPGLSTDTHLAVTIVAIDDEIIQWMLRERRKGRADSKLIAIADIKLNERHSLRHHEVHIR
jgi:hypothetical protein